MSNWNIISKKNLNIEKWNKCVANSNNEIIYGYSWYLDAVAPDWIAFVFGKYEQVFPLPVKQKLGMNYVFQPEFHQRSSLFSSNKIESEIELVELIKRHFIKIDLTSTSPVFKPYKELENSIISFSKNSFTFNSNTQRNIKKALKFGLKYSSGDLESISKSIEMFKENTRFTLGENYEENLAKLSESLTHNQCLEVRNVSRSETVMAWAILAKSKKRIVLLQLGVSEEGKNNGASHFLISECINEFSKQVEIFDFEGSQNSGIAQFYKGFGTEIEKYYHFQKNLKVGVLGKFIKS